MAPDDMQRGSSNQMDSVQTEAELGVTEKLGNTVSLDTTFIDEEGLEVHLADLIDKPTLLLPVYFTCPNVCDTLQANVAVILPEVDLEPGKEYQVISVSFDPANSPGLAKSKKQDYFAAINAPFPLQAWHFLTGNEPNIRALMDSIGFHYEKQGDMYIHPVTAVAVSPNGTIARYLYGTDFLPFDVTMAMTEAAEGKLGLSVKRVLAYCFTYDPEGKRYVLNITRIAGVTILLLLVLFLVALHVSGRKKQTFSRKG